MGKDQTDLAELQKAKFNLSMLETLNELKREIKEQAGEGYIDIESKRKVQQLTSIMNTAGDKRGNILLIQCTAELNQALNPLWPEDFPDPLLTDMYFQQYEDAFLYAVGLHSQRWEFLLQEASKSMYASRIEDKVDDIRDILKTYKKK